jgi:isohexenylglutaconyl-CoA hydratase
MSKTTSIDLQTENGWLTIWLSRPKSRNALTGEMVAELSQVLASVREDRSVRGITFRGRGGFFCAGGDLKSMQAIFQGEQVETADVERFSRDAGKLFGLINAMPQVVIMLVEGAAMAGGLGIVCSGDIVVVTADARFALTETRLGIPPAQIAPFIAQRIGLAAARRIILTALQFDGNDAKELQVADFVVKDASEFDKIEADIRTRVLQCAPHANAATKEILLATQTLDRESMIDLAARRFGECLLSEEGREGVASFVEKRPPKWAP